MSVVTLLPGHVSPETAYVVNDYPYGFRLRCKIRYWLEYTAKKGVRLWSQTTNPKRVGEVWNKAKASTYSKFGGAMYLDEAGHVQWSGLHEYTTAQEVSAWIEQYGAANHPKAVEIAAGWAKAKVAYETRRALGATIVEAAQGAAIESVQ